MSELLERHRYSELYDLGNGQHRLEIGGDIDNPLPFDGGPRAPFNLVYDEGVQQGNWVWLGKGEQGYLVKKNTGTVRLYPVKGDQTKYIQISGLADKACEINQVSNKVLEMYLDKPFTRWALWMAPQGFKPLITLKPGYTGDGVFRFRFELNGGLTLDGAKIMDGTTEVLRMQKPWLEDAEGTIRNVNESIDNGIVTLTPDLTGLVYPIKVDPTLSPAATNQGDNACQANVSTTNFGSANVIWARFDPDGGGGDGTGNSFIKFDFTNIPAGAVIDSALLELYYFAFTSDNPAARTIYANRLTRTNWTELGSNWDTYDGVNNWTTPGGDFTTTDRASDTVPASFGWMDWDVTLQAQYAQANTGNIIHILMNDGSTNSSAQTRLYSRDEAVQTTLRPKLGIIFTAPPSAVTFNRSRIVNLGATGPQNRSTIANA